jgi:ribosomal protein S18 acetylase RimI-like enzyme
VPEIRPFEETDRHELRALAAYAGQGSPSESLWGHMESEAAVYLDPYLDLEPESVFVALQDGALVGYLCGCLDTAAFPSEDDRIVKAVREYRLLLRPAMMGFFARSALDLASARVRRQRTAGAVEDARWPAHLHMNVAAPARGTGAADGLMNRWLDRLQETGSPGCHLQTLVENTRAVRFFERMGFVRYGDTPLVPGIRYHGRRLHQQTMVWTP